MQRASAHRGGELEREKRTYGKNGEKSGSAEKAYYRIFAGMIVFPLLLVLLISLVTLGRQYKGQAIENIERAGDGCDGASVGCGVYVDASVAAHQRQRQYGDPLCGRGGFDQQRQEA